MEMNTFLVIIIAIFASIFFIVQFTEDNMRYKKLNKKETKKKKHFDEDYDIDEDDEEEVQHVRCPNCGSQARIVGNTWRCDWCGDSGFIRR